MKKVSDSTVGRLSLYLRLLVDLEEAGTRTLSSEELAQKAGTSAAQVRKDLSFFGTFGKRGLGYSVAELIATLRSILGLEQRWAVAVVGAGKIGAALLGYEDFKRQGFHIECVFDNDPKKIGQRWNGLVVQPDSQMEEVLRKHPAKIAIIAVPAEAAQSVVDRLVKAGVCGLLNFAPVKLRVPRTIALKNVNMSMELEGLSYALTNGNGKR